MLGFEPCAITIYTAYNITAWNNLWPGWEHKQSFYGFKLRTGWNAWICVVDLAQSLLCPDVLREVHRWGIGSPDPLLGRFNVTYKALLAAWQCRPGLHTVQSIKITLTKSAALMKLLSIFEKCGLIVSDACCHFGMTPQLDHAGYTALPPLRRNGYV